MTQSKTALPRTSASGWLIFKWSLLFANKRVERMSRGTIDEEEKELTALLAPLLMLVLLPPVGLEGVLDICVVLGNADAGSEMERSGPVSCATSIS